MGCLLFLESDGLLFWIWRCWDRWYGIALQEERVVIRICTKVETSQATVAAKGMGQCAILVRFLQFGYRFIFSRHGYFVIFIFASGRITLRCLFTCTGSRYLRPLYICLDRLVRLMNILCFLQIFFPPATLRSAAKNAGESRLCLMKVIQTAAQRRRNHCCH